MSIRIDLNRCNGCPGRAEACCEEICPGYLFTRHEGKACVRDPGECWDCFSCVKACPRAALSVELPFQISEAKHRLIARIQKDHITWRLLDRSGETLLTYTIRNKANSNSNRETSYDSAAKNYR